MVYHDKYLGVFQKVLMHMCLCKYLWQGVGVRVYMTASMCMMYLSL